jgi:potassium-transporting ATPase KdpC subunit
MEALDMKNIRPCIMVFIMLTLLTGVIYPSAVTIVAQTAFSDRADGSLVKEGNEVRGSLLIAQKFTSPAYFHPRPSASDYSALPSGASNQGPTSALLKNDVDQRRKELASFNSGEIPADLLLASGSGLDPDISPEAALWQVDSVAKARNLSDDGKAELEELVRRHVEEPQMEIFGAPRVNVLQLNMDTNLAFGVPESGGDKRH